MGEQRWVDIMSVSGGLILGWHQLNRTPGRLSASNQLKLSSSPVPRSGEFTYGVAELDPVLTRPLGLVSFVAGMEETLLACL